MQKKSNNADLCILSSPVFYQQQDDVWQTFAVVDVPTEAPGHAQTKFSDATERHLGIPNQYRLWLRKVTCFHRNGAIRRPAGTRLIKWQIVKCCALIRRWCCVGQLVLVIWQLKKYKRTILKTVSWYFIQFSLPSHLRMLKSVQPYVHRLTSPNESSIFHFLSNSITFAVVNDFKSATSLSEQG